MDNELLRQVIIRTRISAIMKSVVLCFRGSSSWRKNFGFFIGLISIVDKCKWIVWGNVLVNLLITIIIIIYNEYTTNHAAFSNIIRWTYIPLDEKKSNNQCKNPNFAHIFYTEQYQADCKTRMSANVFRKFYLQMKGQTFQHSRCKSRLFIVIPRNNELKFNFPLDRLIKTHATIKFYIRRCFIPRYTALTAFFRNYFHRLFK